MATTFTEPLAPPPAALQLLGETTCVVSAGPWFSAVTSAAFGAAAREAHLGGARELLLDLTSVRAVDTAGTAELAGLAEELEELGCEVAVASTHPGLVAWLETSPMAFDVPVHETVADGLADLLARPV